MFDGVPDDVVAKVTEGLNDAFAPYTSSHGVVTDATAWLITATRD